jgi:hypothetical protein
VQARNASKVVGTRRIITALLDEILLLSIVQHQIIGAKFFEDSLECDMIPVLYVPLLHVCDIKITSNASIFCFFAARVRITPVVKVL